jgi:hypothetical protein
MMYFDMYILFSDKDGRMLTDKSIWLSLRGGDKRLIDVNYFFNRCKIIGLCASVGIVKLDDVQWPLIAPTLFACC